jgi:hypothetical protein
VHDVHQEAVARPRRLAGVHHRDHRIRVAQRFERGIHHPDVQPVQGAVNTGGIDEHHLAPWIPPDADDAVARGLRLVGDDGELLADNAV